MPEVTAEVAEKHGLTLADLVGPSRTKYISHARFEAMWLLYQQRRPDGSRRLSMPQLGRFFGGRDHTSVLHGIRRHEQRIAADRVAA